MTSPANINPDVVLAALLDRKVSVQTSATESYAIRAYADEERPNKGVADEFIDIEWNGSARSLTRPLGLFRGNLALVIWCKARADGRAKKEAREADHSPMRRTGRWQAFTGLFLRVQCRQRDYADNGKPHYWLLYNDPQCKVV